MSVPWDWIASWCACVRAYSWRAAGVVAVGLAFGCAADRPPPAAGKTPTAATATAEPAPARPAPTLTIGGTVAPLVRRELPPPVAMPGGGTRIDMRGSTKHTRALERQPDGTFKHVCVDAPEILAPGSAR